ncbi:MAG: BrnT family toxin [Brachymonas sp.]|nr:BrnT family toxin [Brachymonas sp.]
MEIEFDPAKDTINFSKHGVSLAKAATLDWDHALVWLDERFAYQELRMIALAPDSGMLYYVAFVEAEDVYRIISLRAATKREVKHYVENA